jgi:hypothetical protein
MIISHKHKFIFIKTNKTAGTSVEIALSKICGENDILTPLSPEDERYRKQLGYRTAQNYLFPITSYNINDIKNLFLNNSPKNKFFNHISAKKIKKRIGSIIWDNYFKFCFERNPWDRVLSLYYWRHKSEPRPCLFDFINSNVIYSLKNKGYKLYTINDRIVVDTVLFYENIDNEIEKIKQILNIKENIILPKAKSSYRVDRRSYKEVLDDRMRDRIAMIFEKEINLYGYQF